MFNRNELQKLNQQLQEVEFPDDAEIKRKIQVIEKVINMKKIAFLNATNTNFLPECFRDFYMDNATKKIYPWVGNIEEKTRKKLAQELQKRNDTYVQGWKFPLVSKLRGRGGLFPDPLCGPVRSEPGPHRDHGPHPWSLAALRAGHHPVDHHGPATGSFRSATRRNVVGHYRWRQSQRFPGTATGRIAAPKQ